MCHVSVTAVHDVMRSDDVYFDLVPTSYIHAEYNCTCVTVCFRQSFASSSFSCHWCLPQHCYGGDRHHPGFGVQSCRSVIHHCAELSVDLSWGLLWCRSSWSWVGSQDPTGQHLGGECTECQWQWGLHLHSFGRRRGHTASGNTELFIDCYMWVVCSCMDYYKGRARYIEPWECPKCMVSIHNI